MLLNSYRHYVNSISEQQIMNASLWFFKQRGRCNGQGTKCYTGTDNLPREKGAYAPLYAFLKCQKCVGMPLYIEYGHIQNAPMLL